MFFLNAQLAFPTRITNTLFLGSVDTLDDDQFMAEVHTVISLLSNPKILRAPVDQLIIPIEDSKEVVLSPYFSKVFSLIDRGVSENKKVLIHCEKGMSRSASMVIAWQLREQHQQGEIADYDFVLKQLVQSRGMVKPNKGFETQLRLFAATLNVQLEEQNTMSNVGPNLM